MDIPAQPSKLWAGIMSLTSFCQLRFTVLRRWQTGGKGGILLAQCFEVFMSTPELCFAQTLGTEQWSPDRTARRKQQPDRNGVLQELKTLQADFSFLWDLSLAGSASWSGEQKIPYTRQGTGADTQGREKVEPPLSEAVSVYFRLTQPL